MTCDSEESRLSRLFVEMRKIAKKQGLDDDDGAGGISDCINWQNFDFLTMEMFTIMMLTIVCNRG